VTITPEALLPRFLIKRVEALNDKMTTCAFEPVARKPFTPSMTVCPAAIRATACALDFENCGAIAANDGLGVGRAEGQEHGEHVFVFNQGARMTLR
jgi:hypothetical protein